MCNAYFSMTLTGAARVYSGTSGFTYPSSIPLRSALCTGPMASVGDLDGDGYPELGVATANRHDPVPSPDTLSIYTGGPQNLANSRSIDSRGDDETAAILPAGDLDGDGYADFAFSTNANPLWVRRGGPNWWMNAPIPLPGGAPSTTAQMASCDADGDGRPELILAVPNGAAYAGQIYVYNLINGALVQSATLTGTANDRLGAGLAAGDFDGDGYNGDLRRHRQ